MGVRVCRDVFLCYFWCGFAEIYILNCGIAVKIFSKFSECSSDSVDCGIEMGVTVFHAYVWGI